MGIHAKECGAPRKLVGTQLKCVTSQPYSWAPTKSQGRPRCCLAVHLQYVVAKQMREVGHAFGRPYEACWASTVNARVSTNSVWVSTGSMWEATGNTWGATYNGCAAMPIAWEPTGNTWAPIRNAWASIRIHWAPMSSAWEPTRYMWTATHNGCSPTLIMLAPSRNACASTNNDWASICCALGAHTHNVCVHKILWAPIEIAWATNSRQRLGAQKFAWTAKITDERPEKLVAVQSCLKRGRPAVCLGGQKCVNLWASMDEIWACLEAQLTCGGGRVWMPNLLALMGVQKPRLIGRPTRPNLWASKSVPWPRYMGVHDTRTWPGKMGAPTMRRPCPETWARPFCSVHTSTKLSRPLKMLAPSFSEKSCEKIWKSIVYAYIFAASEIDTGRRRK